MNDRTFAPILIAITGKRDLNGKADLVGETLSKSFALLDEQFPGTPKILMSGMAAGADTLAAEIASELPNWNVMPVLALDFDLFVQDFDTAGAENLRRLAHPEEGLFAIRAGRKLAALPPLRNSKTNEPLPSSALVGVTGCPNSDRTDHYEQAGLYIAERCALLIAVKDAGEKPGRVGGTARIVDFRLRGVHDERARNIAERSDVLLRPDPLDFPHPKPVWRIDLAALGTPACAEPLRAVALLRPRHDKSRETVEIETIRWRRPRDLVSELHVAKRVHQYNISSQNEFYDKHWQCDIEARTNAATGEVRGAAAALTQIRFTLSAIQGHCKEQHTRTVRNLALLFVASIFMLEVYIEFDAHRAIVMYSALLLSALALFMYAKWKRWQQLSEDYRAVSEALRLQLVWWAAGLKGPAHRVDMRYLRNVTGSFERIRAVIAHFIDATLVERGEPNPLPGFAGRWIKSQLDFFGRRAKERQLTISLVDDAVWFALLGTLGMALFLGLTTSIDDANVAVVLNWRSLPVGVLGATSVTATIAAFALCHWISNHIRNSSRSIVTVPLQGTAAIMPILAGLLISVGLHDFSEPLQMFLRAVSCELDSLINSVRGWSSELGPLNANAACPPIWIPPGKLVTMTMVIFASIAAALRFYSEKLAQEDEFHRYQEALDAFASASARLTRIAMANGSDMKEQQKEVLLALGEAALSENEAWLRGHRVRPLEVHL